MPPKKKPTPEQLRAFFEDHHIIFAGPVPPRDWPSQHRHHFESIRAIWANRYDEYKQDSAIPREDIWRYKEHVNDLRQKVKDLHTDTRINETTWRMDIENLVLKVFNDKVICPRCENEKFTTPICQADPLDEQRKATVRNKREKRNLCDCPHSTRATKVTNKDDEHGFIFRHTSDIKVSHNPEDNLGNQKVFMKPDRVVGLARTAQFQECILPETSDIEQYPIPGSSTMYPFLVIEAKKDRDTPGFRAIQWQTAFPVRRLLKVQEDLRAACNFDCEPFLVWFLAYQGEDWRLYAGTFENPYTRVYELWFGTIESQDGSLQLLQIIDYIWTWARDIYRPQIWSCLRAQSTRASRTIPVAPNRFYTPSALSETTLSFIDQAVDIEGQYASGLDDIADPDLEDESMVESLSLQDSQPRVATALPFSRWSVGHEHAPPWAKTANIRHSDLVRFSFVVFDITELHADIREKEMHSALSELWQQAIDFRADQLSSISKTWMGTDYAHRCASDSAYATILFRTFCNPLNWQIERQLTCILWPSNASTFLNRQDVLPEFGSCGPSSIELIHVTRALERFRGLRGSSSVGSALQDLLLILGSSQEGCDGILQWKTPASIDISARSMRVCMNSMKIASQNRNLSGILIDGFFAEPRLVFLHTPVPSTESSLGLSQILRGNPAGGILTVRPQIWSSECPKFCLFVVKEVDAEDKRSLGDVLRQTLDEKSIVANRTELNAEEHDFLENWCLELRS